MGWIYFYFLNNIKLYYSIRNTKIFLSNLPQNLLEILEYSKNLVPD